MDVAQKAPDQVQYIIFNWFLASTKDSWDNSKFSPLTVKIFPKFDTLYFFKF